MKFVEDLAYMMEHVNFKEITQFKPKVSDEDMAVSIDHLILSTRAENRLKSHNLLTIGEIINKWDVLKDLNKIGVQSVCDIKIAVLSYLYEKMDDEQIKDFWIRSLT